jgi:hypothetical protein
MWLVINRAVEPDAPQWAGRRFLAVLDAVGWPMAWVLVVVAGPSVTGVVGQVTVALAAWCGLLRLHRAIWRNHRYRFTTWRWARVGFLLLVLGGAMKIVLSS